MNVIQETLLNPSILYADDDEDDCQLFREILSELNFQGRVTIVNDGEHLMSKVHDLTFEVPSIIFLDINMPCKNGIECLEDIRSNATYKSVPVVMLTTARNSSRIIKCFNKEASRYIIKPTSVARLRALIHDILQMDSHALAAPQKNNFLMV
jgi:CheY-like chemotaxis protein